MSNASFKKRAVKSILCSLGADSAYLSILFMCAHSRLPVRNSGLFNDYLYFLKLSEALYEPLRQYTSDKIFVKDYVRSTLGEDFCPQTLAVYHSADELKQGAPPAPSIIKPAHASGCVAFLRTPGDEPTSAERQKLAASLLTSPYETAREKNYRYLQRRLLCEELLPDAEKIKDYKVFCYAGLPRLIQVDSDRHGGHKRNVYDTQWNRLEIRYNYPLGEWEDAPQRLDEMLDLARKLAASFESVRVDFYITPDRLYIGELTHCPESAHGRFDSIEAERQFSDIYFGRR